MTSRHIEAGVREEPDGHSGVRATPPLLQQQSWRHSSSIRSCLALATWSLVEFWHGSSRFSPREGTGDKVSPSFQPSRRVMAVIFNPFASVEVMVDHGRELTDPDSFVTSTISTPSAVSVASGTSTPAPVAPTSPTADTHASPTSSTATPPGSTDTPSEADSDAATTIPRVHQPTLARRTKVFLRQLRIGTLSGIASAVCMVTASAQMVRFDRSPKFWVLGANLTALILALISILQLYLWKQGYRRWAGRPSYKIRPWQVSSVWGAGLSWLLLIAVPLCGVHMARLDVYGGATYWLSLVASILAIFAVFFSARWYFDPAGPPRHAEFPIRRNLPTDSATRKRMRPVTLNGSIIRQISLMQKSQHFGSNPTAKTRRKGSRASRPRLRVAIRRITSLRRFTRR